MGTPMLKWLYFLNLGIDRQNALNIEYDSEEGEKKSDLKISIVHIISPKYC